LTCIDVRVRYSHTLQESLVEVEDVAARFNNFAFWRNSKLEDNDGKLEQTTTEDLHRFYALAQFHKGCRGVTPDPAVYFDSYWPTCRRD